MNSPFRAQRTVYADEYAALHADLLARKEREARLRAVLSLWLRSGRPLTEHTAAKAVLAELDITGE